MNRAHVRDLDLSKRVLVHHWPLYLLTVMLSSIRLSSLAAAQAPPTCPSPALVPLAVIQGAWIVRWRDRVAPERYATSEARATIEATAGGCGLLERFAGMRAGRRFEALTLIAPGSGDSLHRVWQDSEHGAILLFTADARGHPLRFEWSRDLGDRVLHLRTTYRALTTDAFTVETELSPDGAHTWQLVSRQEYRRGGS